jgi:Fur family iron response transcriptional regulator
MVRSDILAKFHERGVLPTAQRMEVANVLLTKAQHLSAEQIIDRLRQENCAVSKATVYNTLNLFIERGLIKECLVDPERRFYDSITEPHHHFYNVDTGELSDIPMSEIEISGLPLLPKGTELQGAELIVRIRNNAN